VEKQTITYEGKRLCSAIFSTKEGRLSTQQSAISEAPTVFSRLPSSMAADKPCPQLQPSLPWQHGFSAAGPLAADSHVWNLLLRPHFGP
jgi:hypothetical protein